MDFNLDEVIRLLQPDLPDDSSPSPITRTRDILGESLSITFNTENEIPDNRSPFETNIPTNLTIESDSLVQEDCTYKFYLADKSKGLLQENLQTSFSVSPSDERVSTAFVDKLDLGYHEINLNRSDLFELDSNLYETCHEVDPDDIKPTNVLYGDETFKLETKVAEERGPKVDSNDERNCQREVDGDVDLHSMSEESVAKQDPRSDEKVQADLNTEEDCHLLLRKGRIFEDRKAVILFMDTLSKSKKTAFVITNSSTKNSTNLIYSCKHGKKRRSESKGIRPIQSTVKKIVTPS